MHTDKTNNAAQLLKIAIIGRPNVGKSSLFNRIAGSRTAITDERSGTTRDRVSARISYKGKRFTLIDTGGFEEAREGEIAALVLKQLHAAIQEADIILFVTDATVGILPQDVELAERLRKTSKKMHLVVNKVDGMGMAAKAMEFFELGLGEPIAVSALNSTGIDALLRELTKDIEGTSTYAGNKGLAIAIVGRPNVGKSSYVNAILKEDRVIVHDTAGTTRDAIDIDFNYNDNPYILIDTAGIRHNPKLKEPADFFSVVRAREAIKRADAAIVVIDGFDGLREDDIRIINAVTDEGKAFIVAVNKSDLMNDTSARDYTERLGKRLNILNSTPIIFTSCKTGRNVIPSLDLVRAAHSKSSLQLASEELSALLQSIRKDPLIQGNRITCLFLRQTGSRPPQFTIGIKGLRAIPEHIKRHIENILRKARDLKGVPLQVRFDVPTRSNKKRSRPSGNGKSAHRNRSNDHKSRRHRK